MENFRARSTKSEAFSANPFYLCSDEKVESSGVYDGSLYSFYSVYLRNAANDRVKEGEDADAALEKFVAHCNETIEERKADGEIS